MSKRFSEELQAFLEYWSRQVDRGKNSPLDRIEIMTLEIYDNWRRSYSRRRGVIRMEKDPNEQVEETKEEKNPAPEPEEPTDFPGSDAGQSA